MPLAPHFGQEPGDIFVASCSYFEIDSFKLRYESALKLYDSGDGEVRHRFLWWQALGLSRRGADKIRSER